MNFDFANPYTSTRLPVFARNVVSTSHPLAAQAGLRILQQGGNAVDAAVATGFALAVTYPRAGNIGGGGFRVIHSSGRNEDAAIDYRETAPGAITKDVFLGADGKPDTDKSRTSARGRDRAGSKYSRCALTRESLNLCSRRWFRAAARLPCDIPEHAATHGGDTQPALTAAATAGLLPVPSGPDE